MKSSLLMLFGLAIGVNAFSQIEITTNHLPDEGDVLIQQNVVQNTQVDVAITGAATVWDFDDYFTPLGAPTVTNCISISTTPFTFQLFFNNPFDQEHDSDYATGIDQLDLAGQFTVEDAYFYYQNRTDRFANTGMAASLNSIPLGAQSTPVDVIYELPLQFENESSSYSEINFEVPTMFYYRLQQTRTNIVDGYGTLIINGNTFDVLRVRSEIEATDSVYVDQFGFGFNLPRPLTVEYKWLSQDFIVPVLQINTQNGIATTTQTADIYTSVEELSNALDLNVYPNPAVESIQINGSFSGNASVMIRGSFRKRSFHKKN
ncbi:MAG: hypothetical protein R2809_14785 [Flavobacteriales bacterium]